MHDMTDARLEGLLRRTLRDEAEHAPVILTPEALEERARLRAHRRRRRSLTILAFAAVLLLPVSGLLLVGALNNEQPLEPALGETYAAVMVRITPADLETFAPHGVEIVAVAADGRERTVATIPSSAVPAPWIMGGAGSVSADGWLALSVGGVDASEAIALIDLRGPSAPARIVTDPSLGIGANSFSWGPDGRFATWINDGAVLVVDPRSGTTVRVSPFEIGIDGLFWTADGSGFLSADGGASSMIYEDPLGSPTVPPGGPSASTAGPTSPASRPWRP